MCSRGEGGVPYISCVVIVYVPFQKVCFVNPWFQTGCIVYSLAIYFGFEIYCGARFCACWKKDVKLFKVLTP